MELAICRFRRASTAKDIGPCIGRLMQDSQDVVVLNWSPGDFSLMRPTDESGVERAGGAGESGVRLQMQNWCAGS